MDHLEFAADLKLDPSQLDVECVRQGETFFKWAERYIKARSDMDRLELAHKVREAKLQNEVRRDPEKFKVENPTEASIKAAVMSHRDYIAAHEKWLTAREDYTMLEKAVAAMDMKKRQLENLITLHGQQYFAGPSTPRNLVAAYEAHQDAIGASVSSKQKAMTRQRGQKRRKDSEEE